ncbi:MAG: NUDIX hydrolase [Ktedonobacterales bacterium]
MLTEPEGRFLYRVAGVAFYEGHVLLHRAESDAFWSLPGGRCELLEPSTVALRRELREELGTAVEVERLLLVVENFFTLDGLPHHELGLYYQMVLPTDSPLLDIESEHRGDEVGLSLVFRWYSAGSRWIRSARRPSIPCSCARRCGRRPRQRSISYTSTASRPQTSMRRLW